MTSSNPKAISGKKPTPTKSKPTSKVIKGSNKNSGAGYSEDDGGSAPVAKKKAPVKKTK